MTTSGESHNTSNERQLRHNQAPVDSVELFEQFASGNDQAANLIFERYLARLVLLARKRLSAKLASRIDPDDVVMSAYRSFFLRARRGEFALQRGGDLWRLLVQITLHKLYRQAAHHRAQRRSITREVSSEDGNWPADQALSKEPTPELAAAAADELELLLSQLTPAGRRVIELRLQGEELVDIARCLECSERTVRRLLKHAKDCLVAQNMRDGLIVCPSVAPVTKKLSPKPRLVSDIDCDAPLAFQDFRLHEQLGMGATGRVYRATHLPTGEVVAVKYLKKAYVLHAEIVAHFVAEARIVAGLRHPGIVAVHGLGRTPTGGFFIVMQFVNGPDLQRHSSTHAIPFPIAVRWLQSAAEAIAFAHRHGVIHCDLKPSNLLLDEAKRVLVTDFGLARAIHLPDESWHGIAGTPAFMAPEQVDSVWGTVGPHTDVYGLGAILYALLFGQPPFPGQRTFDIFAEVIAARPVQIPVEQRSRLPPTLVAICERSLSKKPSDRYTSAEELGLALAEFLSVEELSAPVGS